MTPLSDLHLGTEIFTRVPELTEISLHNVQSSHHKTFIWVASLFFYGVLTWTCFRRGSPNGNVSPQVLPLRPHRSCINHLIGGLSADTRNVTTAKSTLTSSTCVFWLKILYQRKGDQLKHHLQYDGIQRNMEITISNVILTFFYYLLDFWFKTNVKGFMTKSQRIINELCRSSERGCCVAFFFLWFYGNVAVLAHALPTVVLGAVFGKIKIKKLEYTVCSPAVPGAKYHMSTAALSSTVLSCLIKPLLNIFVVETCAWITKSHCFTVTDRWSQQMPWLERDKSVACET